MTTSEFVRFTQIVLKFKTQVLQGLNFRTICVNMTKSVVIFWINWWQNMLIWQKITCTEIASIAKFVKCPSWTFTQLDFANFQNVQVNFDETWRCGYDWNRTNIVQCPNAFSEVKWMFLLVNLLFLSIWSIKRGFLRCFFKIRSTYPQKPGLCSKMNNYVPSLYFFDVYIRSDTMKPK